MLMLQAMALNSYLINGDLPAARNRAETRNPLMNTYRCGDDKLLAVAGVNPDRYWADFAKVMGLDDIVEDPRFRDAKARTEHSKELIEMLDTIFLTRPRDEWVESMRQRRLNCQPVQDYTELPTDPQIVANDYITTVPHPTVGSLTEVGIPIALSETPGRVRGSAPGLGQHTDEILQEFGYSLEEVAGFRERGAV